MHRRFLFIILPLITIASSISCSRDAAPDNSNLFYGKWKTSYGDTITFSQQNGKNILSYNHSMNATLPVITKNEFTSQNNKLGIKDGMNGNDFRILRTFKWKQRGHSFEVQGLEWFMFISSTTTYFTFTKIR